MCLVTRSRQQTSDGEEALTSSVGQPRLPTTTKRPLGIDRGTPVVFVLGILLFDDLVQMWEKSSSSSFQIVGIQVGSFIKQKWAIRSLPLLKFGFSHLTRGWYNTRRAVFNHLFLHYLYSYCRLDTKFTTQYLILYILYEKHSDGKKLVTCQHRLCSVYDKNTPVIDW